MSGRRVRGGPLDTHEWYIINEWGGRYAIPGTRRIPAGASMDDVQNAIDEHRRRNPPQDPSEITPTQPNLPATTDISPEDHVQRTGYGSRSRRSLFPDTDTQAPAQPPANPPAGDMNNNNAQAGPQAQAQTTALARTTATTAAATTSSQQTSGARKRAIMPMYTSPDNFYLPERQMARLPLKIHFSINGLNDRKGMVLQFKLNEYFNQFANCEFRAQPFGDITWNTKYIEEAGFNVTQPAPPGDQVVPQHNHLFKFPGVQNVQNRVRGFSNDMAYDQIDTETGALLPKPVNMNLAECRKFQRTCPAQTAGTGEAGKSNGTTGSGKFGNANGDIKPDYRNFYDPMYQVRHVHGCSWKMTLESAYKSDQQDIVAFHKVETVTTGNDSANQNLATAVTNNVREADVRLHEMSSYRGFDSDTIKGKYGVLKGSWKSSDGHHDVIDADEIKDWYPTSPDPNSPVTLSPTYQEFQTIVMYTTGGHDSTYNCLLEVDYFVEYKDLRRPFRFIKREEENTTLLGHTGKLSDIFAHFPTPVDNSTWPGTKRPISSDIGQVQEWLGHMSRVQH